jgi:hypothetical protein
VPGNGIFIYNVRTREERPVVTAAELPGGKGLIGKISLSFDAKKIVFDFRKDQHSGFRIWEVNADGSGLRQVSFPPADEAVKVARWRESWHTETFTPVICRMARSSFPPLVANTPCSAAAQGNSSLLAYTA